MHRIAFHSSSGRKRPRTAKAVAATETDTETEKDLRVLDDMSIMMGLPAQHPRREITAQTTPMRSYHTPSKSLQRCILSRSFPTLLAVLVLLYEVVSPVHCLAPPALQRLQMKQETMFLDRTKATWVIPVSPDIRSQSPPKLVGSLANEQQAHQRVLGFDVATQLRSSVSSSFDTSRETTNRLVLPMGKMSYKFDTTSQEQTASSIDTMTVVQLKAELGNYGLIKSGPKAVLQERLRKHLQKATTAQEINIAAILQRRKEILKQKSEPKQTKPPVDARSLLKNIYQKPSSSLESSQHASRVYQAAKEADQAGDRNTAKELLRSLDSSHDARILRRLARMEDEDGNTEEAKNILKQGLETHHKNNAFLWNGLANLEDSVDAKREYYQKAIEADPHVPHSHHALGTLEHTEGRIKEALAVLKTGLKYCPTNHRLHHALGDLYRDAKVLKRATDSYQKAIEFGPEISRGYALTALAFCAYDAKNMSGCREYLQSSVDRNPRQANAWVALAQFEESLGNDTAARETCRIAIARYERGLLKKYRPKSTDFALKSSDPVAYKNQLLSKLPRRRSGDKFINVYRTWLRLEGKFGSREDFEEVLEQASSSFTDVRIQLDAANYYVRNGLNEKARTRFVDACKCLSRSVDAFRLFGQHEMRLGNFALARRIFYTGAMTGRSNGLAELLYTWAICEWHTQQNENVSSLFDLAIEETNEDDRLRAFMLYVSARFELSRGEHHRAQHFVGRCLSEHASKMPGGIEQVWTLWKQIAEAMGDSRLARHCHHQAWQSVLEEDEATRVQTGDLQKQMRNEPWMSKISNCDQEVDSVYNLNILPDGDEGQFSLFENSLASDESLVNF